MFLLFTCVNLVAPVKRERTLTQWVAVCLCDLLLFLKVDDCVCFYYEINCRERDKKVREKGDDMKLWTSGWTQTQDSWDVHPLYIGPWSIQNFHFHTKHPSCQTAVYKKSSICWTLTLIRGFTAVITHVHHIWQHLPYQQFSFLDLITERALTAVSSFQVDRLFQWPQHHFNRSAFHFSCVVEIRWTQGIWPTVLHRLRLHFCNIWSAISATKQKQKWWNKNTRMIKSEEIRK